MSHNEILRLRLVGDVGTDSETRDEPTPIVTLEADTLVSADGMALVPVDVGGGVVRHVGVVVLDVTADALDTVLADVRGRYGDDEPTPVTARHLDTLGLRDAVLALALSES